MTYTKPALVTSPKSYVSNVRVIYDGGDDGVSIAQIDWERKSCFAMRWNIARREWEDSEKIKGTKVCLGMPTSRGFPVWFVLPDGITDKDSEIRKAIESLSNEKLPKVTLPNT